MGSPFREGSSVRKPEIGKILFRPVLRWIKRRRFCPGFSQPHFSRSPGYPVPERLDTREASPVLAHPRHRSRHKEWHRRNVGLSDRAARKSIGEITEDKIREIAEAKMKDLNAIDVQGAMRIIEGTARSMGIEVVKSAG